ncbi:hypothetical protein ACZ87_02188 [Candidatus Erwinia dacicola]|uniref:Uncharacterized protein n=1 Tax=Candidatus Erwinia dacicola TaxID=252393 RepID=A0A328TT54_9GAMM|nr:hypothetical protein ACZ87_02188 [Candidatus Erwinia dacicola]
MLFPDALYVCLKVYLYLKSGLLPEVYPAGLHWGLMQTFSS